MYLLGARRVPFRYLFPWDHPRFGSPFLYRLGAQDRSHGSSDPAKRGLPGVVFEAYMLQPAGLER
jgi:hypothetical protein